MMWFPSNNKDGEGDRLFLLRAKPLLMHQNTWLPKLTKTLSSQIMHNAYETNSPRLFSLSTEKKR